MRWVIAIMPSAIHPALLFGNRAKDFSIEVPGGGDFRRGGSEARINNLLAMPS